MKLRILILTALFAIPMLGSAQKLTEKELIGTWKLIIVVNDDDDDDDDAEDYIDRDIDESFLGHVISSGVRALVSNIIDEIDITFEFLKNGRLEVYAMGERDDDDNRWVINSKGELIIMDEDDDYEDDEVWVLEDKKLVAYEKHGSRKKVKNVYLKKLDR